MTTMWPSPLCSSAGSSALVTRMTPMTLVSYMPPQWCSSASAIGSGPSPPPALLTRTETSGRASASSATESGSVTSRRSARPPTSRTTSSTRSRRLAAPTTSKPAPASDLTVAAPIPLLAPVTSAILSFPFKDETLPGRKRRDPLRRPADRLEAACRRERPEAEPGLGFWIEGDLAGDHVARHPCGTTPPCDLTGEFSLAALGVEPPLAGDHRVRLFEAPVEADHSEHERRSEHEVRAEGRPETPGETSGSTRQRSAPGVARQRAGLSDQPRGQPLDLLGRGALLGREHVSRPLEGDRGVAEHFEPRVAEPTGCLERIDRSTTSVYRCAAAGSDQDPTCSLPGRRGD